MNYMYIYILLLLVSACGGESGDSDEDKAERVRKINEDFEREKEQEKQEKLAKKEQERKRLEKEKREEQERQKKKDQDLERERLSENERKVVEEKRRAEAEVAKKPENIVKDLLGANFNRGRDNTVNLIDDSGTEWQSKQEVMKKLFEQDPPLFAVALVSGLQHDNRSLYRLMASFKDLDEQQKKKVIASKINNKNFISYLMEFYPKKDEDLSYKQNAIYATLEPFIENAENDVDSIIKDINLISYSPFFKQIFSGVSKWKDPANIKAFLGALSEKEFSDRYSQKIKLSSYLFSDFKDFTGKYLDAFKGTLLEALKKLYKK